MMKKPGKFSQFFERFKDSPLGDRAKSFALGLAGCVAFCGGMVAAGGALLYGAIVASSTLAGLGLFAVSAATIGLSVFGGIKILELSGNYDQSGSFVAGFFTLPAIGFLLGLRANYQEKHNPPTGDLSPPALQQSITQGFNGTSLSSPTAQNLIRQIKAVDAKYTG